jgi:hypothetical protein
LLSFNGISFDAPFLSARYAHYGMETALPHLGHYDIYKSIAPYKKILKLDNLKQKTLEKYLGIDRTDQYNGGELIGVYHSYVKHPDEETRSLLLQHNHDDVQGMIRLLPLFSYAELFNGNFRFESYEIYNYTTMNGTPAKELHIRFSMQCRLPKDFSAGYGSYYLKTSGGHFTLRIRIYEEELKYFYPNYKDYYYLPYEDEAIHKSVAFCVDKDYRIQAKAATCYSRKNGCFLPQQDEWVLPYFKSEYKDKHTYFELTDDFLNSPEHLTTYARHILDFLTKK